MNGKIDINGHLYIERGGVLKQMQCKKADHIVDQRGNYIQRICRDNCPHFSEPQPDLYSSSYAVTLEICHEKVLKFKEFEDERQKSETRKAD